EAHFGLHSSKLIGPEQLAVEVITIKPVRTKVRQNVFAISDWRGRCVSVILMMSFMGNFLAADLVPKLLAGISIKANGDELERFSWSLGALGGSNRGRLGTDLSRVAFFTRRNRGENKNLVPPNDRRGTA